MRAPGKLVEFQRDCSRETSARVHTSHSYEDAIRNPRHAVKTIKGNARTNFLEAALKAKTFVLIAELAFLVSIAGTAFAHHGTANYDMTKVVTLKGTVTDFQFINPHTLILFDVKNDKGVVEHWQAEATSPNHLVRTGWTKDIIKAGDQITISGFRAKNGSTVMRFQKMVLANGQEIVEGGE